MRCRRCHSPMIHTDCVVEGHARQDWYRCPVCATGQTVSRPYEAPLQRIGSLQRCSGEQNRPHTGRASPR